ncbi:DUF4278 domain-containing protein [Leptodesmis sp.]|uniref:DUF4278 domain-containing protein n=1 Tax=Leptodesmis sp. TaxID=3100501 RepID=UPI004053526D
MKLLYRGVSYNYAPATVETAPTGLAGKYRGAAVNFRTATQPIATHPALELIYRGVRYQTGVADSAMVPQAAIAGEPYELIYRGVHYQGGTPKAAAAKAETVTETCRQLIRRDRLHTEKRELSVLGRFVQAVEAPETVWSAYDLYQPAAS